MDVIVGVSVTVVGSVLTVVVTAVSVVVTVGVTVSVTAGTVTVVGAALVVVLPEVTVGVGCSAGVQDSVRSASAARNARPLFGSFGASSDHKKRVTTVRCPSTVHSPIFSYVP